MKENYERWMNREIQRFQARGGSPPPAAAQLLRSLQQRSAGKRLPVFRNYRLLLQPQYIPQRRISPQGAGAKAVFSAVSSRLLGDFFRGGLSAGTVLSSVAPGTGIRNRKAAKDAPAATSCGCAAPPSWPES